MKSLAITLKIGSTLLCAALAMAPSLTCEAGHHEAARPRHHKPGKVIRPQAAKPYGASFTEEQARRALIAEISRKLGSKIRDSDYPEEARRQGWSGTTLVRVVVGANGKFSQVSLSQTSGFRLLDEQALRMVERVSIWWIPQRLRRRAVGVDVPVGFYIRGAEPGKDPGVAAASRLAVSGGGHAFEDGAWELLLGADTSVVHWRTAQTSEWPPMIFVLDALFQRADDNSCSLVGSAQI